MYLALKLVHVAAVVRVCAAGIVNTRRASAV